MEINQTQCPHHVVFSRSFETHKDCGEARRPRLCSFFVPGSRASVSATCFISHDEANRTLNLLFSAETRRSTSYCTV
jgi:hypothetical protein